MKHGRKQNYQDLEFDVELEPVEQMTAQYKEDLCQMWSEIHFGILEES